MARWIMLAGVALLVIGAILQYSPGLFSWFGNLPGDINIESRHGRVFIPITSMIIISLILTLLMNLFKS